jgi:hypothetical protein
VKKVDDDKCDLRKKYEAESNCTGKEECKGQWYAGPWTAVSIFSAWIVAELPYES